MLWTIWRWHNRVVFNYEVLDPINALKDIMDLIFTMFISPRLNHSCNSNSQYCLKLGGPNYSQPCFVVFDNLVDCDCVSKGWHVNLMFVWNASVGKMGVGVVIWQRRGLSFMISTITSLCYFVWNEHQLSTNIVYFLRWFYSHDICIFIFILNQNVYDAVNR